MTKTLGLGSFGKMAIDQATAATTLATAREDSVERSSKEKVKNKKDLFQEFTNKFENSTIATLRVPNNPEPPVKEQQPPRASPALSYQTADEKDLNP